MSKSSFPKAGIPCAHPHRFGGKRNKHDIAQVAFWFCRFLVKGYVVDEQRRQ